MLSKEILLYGIDLVVTYEKNVYDREPYSYGYSRGTDVEHDIISVSLPNSTVNILELLSEYAIEAIEEKLED